MKSPFNQTHKHSAEIPNEYFAKFNDLNNYLEKELLEQAMADTGMMLLTFPEVSLEDLNLFLKAVQKLMTEKRMSEVVLGDISYFKRNTESEVNQMEIGWADVKITPHSDNFVVETLRAVYNSEVIRKDSNIKFSQLNNAALEFINIALTSVAAFKNDDMPDLPSKVTFDVAIENNSVLKIQSKHVGNLDVITEVDSIAIDDIDSEASDKVNVPTTMTKSFNQLDEQKLRRERGKELIMANQENNPEIAYNGDDRLQSNSYLLLAGINLKAPQFQTDVSARNIAEPQDSDYALVMLNNATREANDRLKNNEQMYMAAIRERVLSLIEQGEKRKSAVEEEILESDSTSNLTKVINQSLQSKFTSLLNQNSESENRNFDKLVNSENERHRAELTRLSKLHSNKIEEIKINLDIAKQTEFEAMLAEKLAHEKALLADKAKVAKHKVASEIESEIGIEIQKLVFENTQKLDEDFERLQEKLEVTRESLINNQLAVIQAKAQSAEVELEGKHAGDLEQKYADLLEKTRQTNRQAIEQASAKDQEINELRLKIDRMAAALAEKNSYQDEDDGEQLLSSPIVSTHQENKQAQNNSKWKAFFRRPNTVT